MCSACVRGPGFSLQHQLLLISSMGWSWVLERILYGIQLYGFLSFRVEFLITSLIACKFWSLMESYLLTFSPMKKKGIPFIWPQKLSHIALLWLNLCWDYLLIFLSYFFLKVFYLWTGRVAQVVKCLPSKSSKCEPLNSSPSTTRKKKNKRNL
jgi:hypothetical protein